MDLISYPFRLSPKGEVQTTEDGEDYYAEELAMLIKTMPGERDLVPDFGITDPTFNTFSESELLSQITMFGPPVTIQGIKTQHIRDGIFSVSIDYIGMDPDDPDLPTYGLPEYTDNDTYDEDNNDDDNEFGFDEADEL